MTLPDLVLRAYRPGEAARLVPLFRAAVHQTAASHYDAAQRAAWAPDDIDAADWEPRLAAQHVVLAECGGELAGFVAWDDDGHVDLLFTAPAFGRRGIASLLCRHAEAHLRAAGVARCHTQASHLSRPVFERLGWHVLRIEQVQREGVTLERFGMEKTLD